MKVFIFKKIWGKAPKTLLLTLLLGVAGMTNAQRSFIVGDLEYGIIDDTDNVIVWHHKDGTMATGELTIPETIEFENHTYTVTEIGDEAFYDCHGLTGDLVIPNTVTTIYPRAFRYCDGFSGTLTLGNSVEYIGVNCFQGCVGIVNINFPITLTHIDDNAFYNTGWLNNQPDGIVYQDGICFGYHYHDGMEEPTGDLQIAEGTRLIACGAFYGCQFLTSLKLPSSLGYINRGAFAICFGLTSIRSLAVEPPVLAPGDGIAFGGVDMSIPVMVPMGSLNAYQNAEEWNEFTNIYETNTYDFEDGTLQGWTTIDADGDGFDWYNYYGWGHNDSDHFATSESYDSASGTALTPDNYLVSPQVELGGSISFWACAMDEDYPEEHFGVAVSTTNKTNPSAFTMLNEWTITAKRVDDRSQSEWLQYTVDLSAYAGHTGYVAIRHFGCTDQYLLNIDDIEITLGATGVSEQNEMALSLYPNPAGESLRIEGLEADATVEIYNILGSLVKTVNVTPDQEINVGELSEGLYLLRCGQQTLRFVKE